MNLSLISVPCTTISVFERILTIDWYDGFTSGAVYCVSDASAYRFDLITWGPGQDMRIFALSRIAVSSFERVVLLWSQLEPPQWPLWHVPWQKTADDLPRWNRELDMILADAPSPGIAIETDALFQTLVGIKPIMMDAPALPECFDGQSFLDNYNEWHHYLGASA